MKIKFIFSFLIFLFSCNTKIDSRSLNSVKLLHNKKIDCNNKKLLFLPTNFCGACSQESIELIKKYFTNKKNVLIIYNDETTATLELKKQLLSAKFISFPSDSLSKYGLNFAKARFINISNEKVICSYELKYDFEESIKNCFAEK